MPLPLTISCSSKIQIGFTHLVPADPASPGQRAVKRVCVCVSEELQLDFNTCNMLHPNATWLVSRDENGPVDVWV